MATLKAFDMCLSFRRMTVGPLDRETCQPSCVFVAFFGKAAASRMHWLPRLGDPQ